MRFVVAAMALFLPAGHALAQPTPTPAPAAPQATQPAPKRLTFTQRFEAANTTHDGRLTRDQAAAAHMASTVRHFDAIDKDNKGYATLDDFRAYAATQRAQRHTAPAKPPA